MNATDRMTITDFIQDNKIRLTCDRTPSNPHMEGSENMDNYKCALSSGPHRMTVYFSKGIGHNGTEPKAAEVLDCLASDAASFENASGFADWASDLGYDTESRKAEKTFRTVERQAIKLRSLLGSDAYEQLLWNTERE